VHDRGPGSLKERPPAPEHNGRGQHKLEQFSAAMCAFSQSARFDEGNQSPAIAIRKTGSASAAPIQNRRRMSSNSGPGPSSADGIMGSSAIPHLGHAPGRSCTTSGCIGQVYFAPGGADALAGGLALAMNASGAALELLQAMPAAEVIVLARVVERARR